MSVDGADEELAEHASAGLMTPRIAVREPVSAASMKLFEPERNLWAVVMLDGVSAATTVLKRDSPLFIRNHVKEAREWIFTTCVEEPPAFAWICNVVVQLDVEAARAAIQRAIAEKRWLRLNNERRRAVTYTSQIGAASWTWHEAKAVVERFGGRACAA